MTLAASLPMPSPPGGLYRPVLTHRGIACVSGQLPRLNGEVKFIGRVGRQLDLSAAREAARLCAAQALAALDQALGGLQRIEQVMFLTGYVACTEDFVQQPAVIDAASEYLMTMLGSRGAHARAAIGVLALPHGAAVEVQLMAAVHE